MTIEPYTREQMKYIKESMGWDASDETVETLKRLIATIEAAWAEIARLLEFGRNYADHASACPVLDEETGYSRECDCGYEAEWRALYRPDAALARGDAAENKEEGNAD